MTDLTLLNELHARIDQLWREVKRLRQQNWQLVCFLHDRVIQYAETPVGSDNTERTVHTAPDEASIASQPTPEEVFF